MNKTSFTPGIRPPFRFAPSRFDADSRTRWHRRESISRREDSDMCELTATQYEAAAQPQHAALGQPREFFTIADKDGKAVGLMDSRELAEAKRIVWDHEYGACAPHRVIRLVECAP